MPLLWLSLAFLGGIALASILPLSTSHWLGIGAGSIFALLLRYILQKLNPERRLILHPYVGILLQHLHYPVEMPLALCFLALSLGGWRYQWERAKVQDFLLLVYRSVGRDVVVQGMVSAFPDERDTYTALTVAVEHLSSGNTEQGGKQSGQRKAHAGQILVRASPLEEWRYGDRVSVSGRLELPPEDGEFSYRAYLARKEVLAYLPRAEVVLVERQPSGWVSLIYRFRSRCHSTIKTIFPEPQASLLAGILLGIESGIPTEVRQAFVKSGTMHIVAISGFNITLLTGLFMAIFGRILGRWRGTILSVLLIGLYTILVGAAASVVRAAVMGVLSLFAAQIGRRQSGINSLAFVAALMTVFEPDLLWDVSFQLSFAATLGLVLYASPLNEWAVAQIRRFAQADMAQRLGNLLSEWALFTLAAQVTTLPIILFHFRQISLVALLVNPLILPVQPILMTGSGLAMFLALIYLPIGQLLAYLVLPFATYTIRLAEWSAALPYSAVPQSAFPLSGVFFFYLILFLLTKYWQKMKVVRQVLRPSLIMSVLLLGTIGVWQEALSAPDGYLHLVLLDVSRPSQSSEAVLIQTPQGRYILLNGGDSPSRLLDAVDRWLPPTHRRLDWVVVGGSRSAQISAVVELIERKRVDNLWWAIPQGGSSVATAIQRAAKEHSTAIHLAQEGQYLDLGEEAQLTLLGTGERGAALLLEWRRFRAFFPLGLDTELRRRLFDSGELSRVTLWLLAYSGSSGYNPKEFLYRLQPQLIWLSVAPGDWYGLPHQETLERLRGYPVLRTDRDGWIHLITDGEQMWVEVEKKASPP